MFFFSETHTDLQSWLGEIEAEVFSLEVPEGAGTEQIRKQQENAKVSRMRNMLAPIRAINYLVSLGGRHGVDAYSRYLGLVSVGQHHTSTEMTLIPFCHQKYPSITHSMQKLMEMNTKRRPSKNKMSSLRS